MDFKAGGWVVYGERLSLGTTFSPVWLSRICLTFDPSSRSLPCGAESVEAATATANI